MDEIFTIIRQDLEVAEKAIEENDYPFVTVIGNRIMINLLAGKKAEFMILGWIIRDLGNDLVFIKLKKEKIKGKSKGMREIDDINEFKRLSKDYLRQCQKDITQENIQPQIFYDNYNILQAKLRKFILFENEKTTYDEQSAYSKRFALSMIDLLYANRNMLFSKNNNLLPSIVGELSRTYNEYGGNDALKVYFIFKSFESLYKYSYIEMFFHEESDKLWDTKSKLNEYCDLIYIFKSYLIDDKEKLISDEFISIMSKIGLDFRIYHLNYGDIRIMIQGEVNSKET